MENLTNYDFFTWSLNNFSYYPTFLLVRHSGGPFMSDKQDSTLLVLYKVQWPMETS